eukprot:CAMPEP_0185853876 /NCGR_PEP_ID=MMETSP1354-20130828/20545_1 /TAXON_ID=708628 /ORGANISM="Erythrolobus madagascarensis, Strain CCMP3276" /LENGTH=111 /DNA_ID=CAMNT_0028555495 /DNA_START=19 /DNA_END=352 /DNA_ORIENTATION=+
MRALATVAAKETTKLLQLAVGRQHIEHQADLEKFQLEAENELGLMRAEYERALKLAQNDEAKNDPPLDFAGPAHGSHFLAQRVSHVNGHWDELVSAEFVDFIHEHAHSVLD